MTNIYNLEPQPYGLIELETNFGKLQIELFTKQCPNIAKSFVQNCLDGYYDDTLFERVEKDFIAVGGAPLSESDKIVENDKIRDEFHTRLKFSRRGLLATANTDKDANGPKFFFTLGPTPELQNKHTIFGRVKGDSIYTLIELNDCHVDQDLKPLSERKIIEAKVIENPFPELGPDPVRLAKNRSQNQVDSSDSEEYYPSRSKPVINKTKKLSFGYDDDDDDEDDDDESESEIKDKTIPKSVENVKHDTEKEQSDLNTEPKRPLEDEDAEGDSKRNKLESNEETDTKQKRLMEIRAQIDSLRRQIVGQTRNSSQMSDKKHDSKNKNESHTPIAEVDEAGIKVELASAKGRDREQETIKMMKRFKQQLKEVSNKKGSTSKSNDLDEHDEQDEELRALAKVDGDSWMHHEFEAQDHDVRIAKDANMKDESWYSIEDPRRTMYRRPRNSTNSHKERHSKSRERSHKGDKYHDKSM